MWPISILHWSLFGQLPRGPFFTLFGWPKPWELSLILLGRSVGGPNCGSFCLIGQNSGSYRLYKPKTMGAIAQNEPRQNHGSYPSKRIPRNQNHGSYRSKRIPEAETMGAIRQNESPEAKTMAAITQNESPEAKAMGAITQNKSPEAPNWEQIVPTSINRCVNPSMHLSMINMSIHQSIDA